MAEDKGVKVSKCPIGQGTSIQTATGVKATGAASGASGAGGYPKLKKKGANN
jgi:hypothetical protein